MQHTAQLFLHFIQMTAVKMLNAVRIQSEKKMYIIKFILHSPLATVVCLLFFLV